jgi:ubiquinone/menaquinone biosynthesis C-methylase UbiE
MGIGALDTDSLALARRLELQHRLSAFDLNAWIFSHIIVQPGQKWLDLGCGRGEQTLPLAQRIGAGGSVTSVDLSEESLAEVRREALNLGVGERVDTIHSNLDNVGEAVTDHGFDRAIASYSLYYASDADAVIASVARLLSGDGELFFCGPGFDNNMELRRLIAEARGEDSALRSTRPSLFMEEVAPTACRKYFASVETFTFDNPVTFHDVDDLMAYWRSHNLFDASFDARFGELAEQAFDRGGGRFVNRKRGVGILAKTPRTASAG